MSNLPEGNVAFSDVGDSQCYIQCVYPSCAGDFLMTETGYECRVNLMAVVIFGYSCAAAPSVPTCPPWGQIVMIQEAANGRVLERTEDETITATSENIYAIFRDQYACSFPACDGSYSITEHDYTCHCPPTQVKTSAGDCVCAANEQLGVDQPCRCLPPFVPTANGGASPDCTPYRAVWDGNRCACQAPLIRTPPESACFYGPCSNNLHVRDQASGRCACQECPGGQIADSATCACRCPNEQHLGSAGVCVWNDCAVGRQRDASGRCACAQCPANQSIIDEPKCSCGCGPQQREGANGYCECIDTQLVVLGKLCDCPGEEVLLGGQCQCPAGRTPGANHDCDCPAGTTENFLDECACSDTNARLDRASLTCVCKGTRVKNSDDECVCPKGTIEAGDACVSRASSLSAACCLTWTAAAERTRRKVTVDVEAARGKSSPKVSDCGWSHVRTRPVDHVL